MKGRDIRTLDTISKEELEILNNKTVGIIGAGGLGGYVIEMLARIGVGAIHIMDGDRFDESNLNRQLLSTEKKIGLWKVEVGKKRINEINSDVKVEIRKEIFDKDNALDFLKEIDVLIDCVDNIKTRLLMEKEANVQGIPLIHGAVAAWNGQVSTVLPGDFTLKKIYESTSKDKEIIGTASFLPALVASYQVAECVKVLTGKGEILQNKMMYFDVLDNNSFIIDLEDDE